MASYADKISNTINSTFVGFALAMSKQVGILQTLLDAHQPLTSHEVADKKNLKERYVRELLCCLVTAEIFHASLNETGALVFYIEEDGKQAFKSPLMAFASFPAGVSNVYNEVKACISKSGPYGTRYSNEMHDCLEEFSVYHLKIFVEKTLEYVHGLKERLEAGIDVIEFGCGRGRLLARFAEMFPKSTFIASEYSPFLLDQLKANLGHIPNIKYETTDLCSLPDTPVKQYDWIYCVDVIHDLPDPQGALKGIRKLVKEPGGIFTMIDMATSGSPIDDKGNLNVAGLYAVSTFLCIPESFQRDDSQALGACWGKQKATNLTTAAGFKVEYYHLENNLAIYLCKP